MTLLNLHNFFHLICFFVNLLRASYILCSYSFFILHVSSAQVAIHELNYPLYYWPVLAIIKLKSNFCNWLEMRPIRTLSQYVKCSDWMIKSMSPILEFQSSLCVRGISYSSFYHFLLEFGTVPTVQDFSFYCQVPNYFLLE